MCSASSAIFNKLSLFTMPLPSTLLILQFGLAIVILGLWNLATVCILGRKAIGITWGSRRDLTRWLPVAVLSVASMWTFLYALESATLSAVVTWRNLAPMPTVRRRTEPADLAPRRRRRTLWRAAGTTSDAPPPLAPLQMFVECCCFSKFRYRATLGATAALALIATGVILYSAFDLQFSRLGTLFIVTNTVLVVAETLYKRRLLIDDADPLHLSKQAMMLMNAGNHVTPHLTPTFPTSQAMMLMNALVGLPIVGVAAAILQRGLSGEEMTLVELWPTFDTGEVLYIVGSGVLMTLFNLSGLRLTALISATSTTVVTNAAKGAVILFGVVLLADEHNPVALAAGILAVFANAGYMYARLQMIEEHHGSGGRKEIDAVDAAYIKHDDEGGGRAAGPKDESGGVSGLFNRSLGRAEKER